MSPTGFSDGPRGSGDNRQFLEIDLKSPRSRQEEAKKLVSEDDGKNGSGTSYYQMAFGGKD